MAKKTIYDFTERPKRLPETVKKRKNKGFGKLKNPTLKSALENCSITKFNHRKHTTIRELGYQRLHQLDMLGIKRWQKYFQSGGKVYLRSDSEKIDPVNRIFFDKGIIRFVKKGTPLPAEEKKPKRGYLKNTPSKVLGFDFYIQTNDKLKKRERETLLQKGNRYFAEHNDNNELDSSLTDIEIVDEWNEFFMQKGYLIPEFHNKWLKRFVPSDSQTESDDSSVTEIPKPFSLSKSKPKLDIDLG